MTINEPLLFQPLRLRDLQLKNRVVISPMCQHAADTGRATPWHMVHLGKFALGGAGLILTESTAVDPRGRIGTADLGLWDDRQIEPLKAVVDFVHANDCAIGVQLAHAGRKSGSQPLWEGGAALTDTEMQADPEPWQRLGPNFSTARHHRSSGDCRFFSSFHAGGAIDHEALARHSGPVWVWWPALCRGGRLP